MFWASSSSQTVAPVPSERLTSDLVRAAASFRRGSSSHTSRHVQGDSLMRYFTSALCTAVGVGLLAACAGNLSGQSGSVPSLTSPSRVAQANNRVPISLVAAWMRPTGIQRLHLGTAFPDKKKKSAGGLYGSEFYSSPTSDAEGLINAYPNPDSKNSAPTCTIDGYAINGWGVDLKQNLILPSASNASSE